MFDKFRYKRRIRRIPLSEIAEIASDDWATTWRKLDISPYLSGSVIVGELEIDGRPAHPIHAQLGYVDRGDVVETLKDSFGLSDQAASDFLDCLLSKADVVVALEQKLAQYAGGVESESGN